MSILVVTLSFFSLVFLKIPRKPQNIKDFSRLANPSKPWKVSRKHPKIPQKFPPRKKHQGNKNIKEKKDSAWAWGFFWSRKLWGVLPLCASPELATPVRIPNTKLLWSVNVLTSPCVCPPCPLQLAYHRPGGDYKLVWKPNDTHLTR